MTATATASAPSSIPMLRALKHYPDGARPAPEPQKLRDDVHVQFLTRRQDVTLPAPLGQHGGDGADRYVADPVVVTELRNGAVLRDGSYVFTERDELVRESVDRLAFVETLASSHPQLGAELAASRRRANPETAALLGSQREVNYFHWWIDVLAKCWLLRESRFRDCPLVAPPLTRGFQRESLQLLDLTVKPLTAGLQRFRRLVFTRGLTGASSQDIVPEVAQFARWCRRRLQLPPAKRSRKLLISRRWSRGRSLTNEAEVAAALGGGFESVVLERLNVREQATLFSQASVIVAPHGAGLTNLLFCVEPTPVVELVPADDSPATFRRLAGLLRHPYIPVPCARPFRDGRRAGRHDLEAPAAAVAAAAGEAEEAFRQAAR